MTRLAPEALPLERVQENEPTRVLVESRSFLDPRLPEYGRFRSWFTRPLLSRPAVMDAEQTRSLDHDLPALLQLLQSLPDRLFGGDRDAFARAVGWRDPTSIAALRLLSGPPTGVGRADLVNSPDGFKAVEFNTSSSLGSFEFGELCRAVLADPGFRPAAERQRLTYVDPMQRLAETLLAQLRHAASEPPVVALVGWVSAPFVVDASLFIGLLRDAGFTVLEGTISDLETRSDGVFLSGTRVDVVYRTFLLKTVAEDPSASALLQPLSDASEAGLVSVFAPLNADVFGSKTCFAMLSDDANRGVFSEPELGVIDRLVPWTRAMSVAGRRSHPEGGSLEEYVISNRGELVLKPSVGHAGRGVVAGWMTTQPEWESLVHDAVGGDYVVQRRVESVAERFLVPSGDGDLAPAACFLHWGLFVTPAGLSGGFVKGLLDRTQDIRYLGDGSHVGCVFHSSN